MTSDVDAALLAKVASDSQLKALMPDGVWWDVSKTGLTRLVIVKLMDHTATDMFGSCAYEEPLYLVKAVEYSLSAANVVNAARRIDTLLNNQQLLVTGYSLMTMQFDQYVRYQEVDTANPDARWQHCGGMYRISVAPN
jgi:hypothetical protein